MHKFFSGKHYSKQIFITNIAPQFQKFCFGVHGTLCTNWWQSWFRRGMALNSILLYTNQVEDDSYHNWFIITLPVWLRQAARANGCYVDDLLPTRSNIWKTHSDATFEKLKTGGSRHALFTLTGLQAIDSNSACHIDQEFYMTKIEKTPSADDSNKCTSREWNFSGSYHFMR